MTRLYDRRLAAWICSALLVFLTSTSLQAHNVGESYLYLQIQQDSVTGRFEIALENLNPALGLSGTEDEITAENFPQHVGFLQEYYRQKVRIEHQGTRLPMRFTDSEVLAVSEGFALLSFSLEGLDSVPDTLTFDYSVLFDEDPDHRGFLLVEYNWATGTFANENRVSLVFSPDDRRQEFELTTDGRLQGFMAVLGLGIEHIWEGIDHILFLTALLLPAVLRRVDGVWQPVEAFGPALLNVVKIVTAFTVAHSLTLSLASLGVVELPGKLVEVIIAVSIAIAAADLIVPIFRGRLWLVVVGFGLFHGFGFAGALSEMGVLSEHVGLSLLAFNLGVEIGQIVIVAGLVPLLYLVRRWPVYRGWGLRVAAAGMILVASVWAAERAFEIDVPMYESLPPALQKILP